jgi:hypothetical protein
MMRLAAASRNLAENPVATSYDIMIIHVKYLTVLALRCCNITNAVVSKRRIRLVINVEKI